MSDPLAALAQLEKKADRRRQILNPRINHWSAGAEDRRRPLAAREAWADMCLAEAVRVGVIVEVEPDREVATHRLLTTALTYSAIATTLYRAADRCVDHDWAWYGIFDAATIWASRSARLASRVRAELAPRSLDPLGAQCSASEDLVTGERGGASLMNEPEPIQ